MDVIQVHIVFLGGPWLTQIKGASRHIYNSIASLSHQSLHNHMHTLDRVHRLKDSMRKHDVLLLQIDRHRNGQKLQLGNGLGEFLIKYLE